MDSTPEETGTGAEIVTGGSIEADDAYPAQGEAPSWVDGGGTYPGSAGTIAGQPSRGVRLRLPLVAVGPPVNPALLDDAASDSTLGSDYTSDPAGDQQAATCAGIVQREGQQLVLDGQPFQFFGTNVHYILEEALPEERIEPIVRDLAARGVAVIRVWYMPGHDEGRFERLLDLGRQHGVRFVVTLEDNVFKGRDWFGSDDDDNKYRPHMQRAARHFGTRPEILMWELINEPNCGGKYDQQCLETIKGWLRGRAREMKAIDRCHLITTGMIGAGNFEEEFVNYRRIHRDESIDVLSMHKRVDEGRDKELKAAVEADKPIILGEVYARGHAEDCTSLGSGEQNRRAERIRDDMRKSLAEGVDGYLLWAHAEGAVERPNGTTQHFCGVYDYERSDPLWAKLAADDSLPPPVPWQPLP